MLNQRSLKIRARRHNFLLHGAVVCVFLSSDQTLTDERDDDRGVLEKWLDMAVFRYFGAAAERSFGEIQ